MEKIESTSMNLEEYNIEKLKELFPNCVTEGKIDFDVLREMLGDEVDNNREKYQFTWNGKAQAIKIAQTPSTATLRPCKEKSKDWDSTENLYIEGDNLEVLKQLQKTYFGKIDCIYIDPPYNTGGDFVYHDDFKNSIDNYIEQTQQKNKSNPETSGRYHSNWLNMMYPRLILARNLLADSGVIFISIDDNEQDNLKKICNEIFGESNFIDTLMVEMSNTGGMKVGAAKQGTITKNGEFIHIYAKNINNSDVKRTALYDYVPGYDTHFSLIRKADGTVQNLSDYLGSSEDLLNEFAKYNVYPKNGSISVKILAELFDKSDVLSKFVFDHVDEISRSRTEIPNLPTDLFIEKGKWTEYRSEKRDELYYLSKDEVGRIIQLVPMKYNYRLTDDFKERYGRSVIRGDYWKGFWIDMGNISKEGNIIFANGKKPVRLIRQLLKWSVNSNKNAIVLDFFSGSATTAHAVFQLNYADNGTRKFILVQLPEADEVDKEFNTICDLGEERIRRSGEIVKKEWQNKQQSQGIFAEHFDNFPLDIGFKVFKLDSTNIKPWDNSSVLEEDELGLYNKVFKDGRSKEDILYEIMLKYGFFDMKASEVSVNGKQMYKVGSRFMLVCLEDYITPDDIKTICEEKPRMVVFKEEGFVSDNDKINAEYNLKKAGVEEVKCI